MLWFRGIDTVLSTPTNQVGLANHTFIDPVNGNDANPGTPQQPKQNLSAANTSNKVLAPSIYPASSGGFSGRLIGNIKERAIVDFEDTTQLVSLTNVMAFSANNNTWSTGGNLFHADTIFVDCPYINPSTANAQINYQRCLFINSDVNVSLSNNKEWNKCIFLNSDVFARHSASQGNVETEFIDCSFDKDSVLTINDIAPLSNPSTLLRCIIANSIVNPNNPTNQTGVLSVPNFEILQQSAIDNLQLFLKDSFDLAQAQNLYYILLDALNYGELVDLSNPDENNGITVGPPITGTGNIKPRWRVYNRVRKSPIVRPNGLSNALDRNIDVSYKSEIGGAVTTKSFIVGLPMLLDDAGRSTGEVGFDPRDIASNWQIDKVFDWDNVEDHNIIDVAEIQENFVLI